MLFCVISYFSVFFSLSLFHAFWNPFQPGFIHSESFRQGYIQLPHYQVKLNFRCSFFLVCHQHLTMLTTFLENLFIWFFAYLTAYPLGLLCDFVSSLDYACWRAPRLLSTAKAFNTIHEVVVPKPDLFSLDSPLSD